MAGSLAARARGKMPDAIGDGTVIIGPSHGKTVSQKLTDLVSLTEAQGLDPKRISIFDAFKKAKELVGQKSQQLPQPKSQS